MSLTASLASLIKILPKAKADNNLRGCVFMASPNIGQTNGVQGSISGSSRNLNKITVVAENSEQSIFSLLFTDKKEKVISDEQ